MNRSVPLSDRWPELSAALDSLSSVITASSAEQLEHQTPCADWDVAQVIEHAALDQLIWVSCVTNGPPPAGNAFAPTGRFDGSAAAFAEPAVAAARAAWASVGDDDTVATPLPQGAMPAETASLAAALDAGVHAWDIAVATGQPSPLTAELSTALLGVARQIIEPLRQWGAYAAALPSQPGDTDADQLLRYLGRDPRWARSFAQIMR